jgi:hypothetical protein
MDATDFDPRPILGIGSNIFYILKRFRMDLGYKFSIFDGLHCQCRYGYFMKSKVWALVLGLVLTLLPTFPASAAIKAGDKCSKLKATAIVSGKKYTCIKSGQKFVWSKGAKVGTSTSTSQPEDSSQPSVKPSSQPESPSSTKSPENSCPTPLLQTPVDLSKVTSILYPGQERGGQYKPHGGFGFDNATDNLVTVKIPLSGKITRVVRYREMGEIQYLFEFDGNCGVSFRLDHLRKLTTKFEAVVSAFPIKEDTRTDPVNPPVAVTVGEVIATEVGILNNVFVDFGVSDRRQKNEASKDPVWASAHSQSPADSYGICWFNSLPQADSAAVKLLPSRDGKNGKSSDYCK